METHVHKYLHPFISLFVYINEQQGIDRVEVSIHEIERKAQEVGIRDLSEFVESDIFKARGFTLQDSNINSSKGREKEKRGSNYQQWRKGKVIVKRF